MKIMKIKVKKKKKPDREPSLGRFYYPFLLIQAKRIKGLFLKISI